MMHKKYKIVALAAIILIIAGLMVATPYRIYGDCMEPAYQNGKLCFLNRLSPYLRKYRINDVIVFNHEEKVWISRIVALENNTIQITKGSIVVDGAHLSYGGIHRNWTGWKLGTYAIGKPFQVPAEHVFVLSDNLSAEHDDSRVFGPIAYSSILGLVW